VTWTPRTPLNPFHEENYVIAWRLGGSDAQGDDSAGWKERPLHRHDDCEEVDNKTKLRIFHDGLPELSPITFRIRAVNAWGQSDWSTEAQGKTLARPSEDGGFTGPLGPANDGHALYTWTQTNSEVGLKVPIGAGRRSKDIKFKVTPARIEIRYVVPEGLSDELLVGSFPKRIKTDEANWQIDETEEDGRHIVLQMQKAEKMEKWPSFIDGQEHPRIDTRLLRFFTNQMGMGDMGGIDIFE